MRRDGVEWNLAQELLILSAQCAEMPMLDATCVFVQFVGVDGLKHIALLLEYAQFSYFFFLPDTMFFLYIVGGVGVTLKRGMWVIVADDNSC